MEGAAFTTRAQTLSHVTLNAPAAQATRPSAAAVCSSQGVGAVASVNDSRFAYNTAKSGRRYLQQRQMTVAGSTVDHNQASAGGGIHHFGGSLALTNSTISQNNRNG